MLKNPENGTKLVEHDQELIRPGQAHNELVYQILAKSGQQFVCKCMKTAQQIRDQETMEIQWSVTKS